MSRRVLDFSGIIHGEMQNAMYCQNGHYVGIVNPILRARSMGHLRAMMERASQNEAQDRLPAFCTECGAPNISACQHCQAPIEPRHVRIRPGYCGRCGKPFTWTERALSAAKEYIDELDLSAEEKTKQKGSLDDLTSDTERTQLAAGRFRKLMDKIGPAAAGVLQRIVETVATEAAKKSMGL
jgi:hypothetical protein